MKSPAPARLADSPAVRAPARPARFGELVLFIVLAAVLAARLLIAETSHPMALSFVPETAVGTTPATTIWLDTVLLVAAAVAWLVADRGPRGVRILDGGLVVLLAAVVVSTWAAADHRAAANAGADLFILVAGAVALVRLVRRAWMVRLLLALVLAGGLAQASKCIIQRTSEFPATIEQWQQQKAELAAAGLDPNAPEIIDYERRMRSQNTYGYLNHPNVTASIIAAAALVIAGVVAGLVRRQQPATRWATPAVLGLAAIGVLCAGLLLTASRGAIASLAAGLILLALMIGARNRIATHPRATLGLLLAVYLGVIGGGAVWGLARGTLPGDSLAFRWEYWRTAARAWRDAPLTGIGRDNFRAAFMRYKTPESTEEVENPHNLWITLLLELGPLGLLAGAFFAAAAMRAGVYATIDPGSNRGPTPPCDTTPPPAGRRTPVLGALAAGVLVLGTWSAATGMPFRVRGDAFGAVLLLWVVFDAGVWVAACALGWGLLARVGETRRSHVAAGMLAAMAALLIHNLVGFSLVTPAGLATFGLLAVAVARLRGERYEPPGSQRDEGHRSRGGPRPAGAQSRASRTGTAILVARAVLVAGVVGAYVTLVAVPTVRGDRAWRAFKKTLRTASGEKQVVAALARAREALAADTWNAELPRLVGATALELARRPGLSAADRREYVEQARALDEIALRRNAESFAARRLRAQVLDELARADRDERTLALAAAAWDAALRLYPTNPRAHIEAGLAWYRLWERRRRPEDARHAATHLRAALAIDATRLPEVAAKLRKAELRSIRARLDRLEAVLEGHAPASRP